VRIEDSAVLIIPQSTIRNRYTRSLTLAALI
jgi:hypothetical protein